MVVVSMLPAAGVWLVSLWAMSGRAERLIASHEVKPRMAGEPPLNPIAEAEKIAPTGPEKC